MSVYLKVFFICLSSAVFSTVCGTNCTTIQGEDVPANCSKCIDIDFIKAREGFATNGYVPKDKDGDPHANR